VEDAFGGHYYHWSEFYRLTLRTVFQHPLHPEYKMALQIRKTAFLFSFSLSLRWKDQLSGQSFEPRVEVGLLELELAFPGNS
jgi:hypothetical protein